MHDAVHHPQDQPTHSHKARHSIHAHDRGRGDSAVDKRDDRVGRGQSGMFARPEGATHAQCSTQREHDHGAADFANGRYIPWWRYE